MDTIREILLEVENSSEAVEKHDKIGAYHISLILDAGLAEGVPALDGAGVPCAGAITRLTWDGHEFLDAMRDDSIWEKVKENIIQPSASWTFALLLECAKNEIKNNLGI